jgi:non-heme chloroperoxidase
VDCRRQGKNLLTRRQALVGGALVAAAIHLPTLAFARETTYNEFQLDNRRQGGMHMSFVTTKDGVDIFYKDWGSGQPIVFHHGWPLSSDDWDAQMLFFLQHGYRVIAMDRRGHGRSTQVSEGHDMDHYAADAAAVVEHLNLRDSIHIGHSTGGGEAARYVAQHGHERVSKLVLVASVPPIMVKTPNNPGGLDISVFDGLRQALAANRAQFFRDMPSGPFYGFNRPENKPIEGVIDNWWPFVPLVHKERPPCR